MKKDLLWTDSRDIWYVHLDPLWGDFHGTPSTKNRPIPFIDAFPVTLWLYKQEETLTTNNTQQQQQQVTQPSNVKNKQPPPLPPRARGVKTLPKKSEER